MDNPEVIIVGAGPAGSSAALKLAQNGVKVVLIDRGMPIGSKNLSGGVIWGNDLAELLPEWQTDAPVERAIKTKKIGILSEKDATVVSIHLDDWKQQPYAGMSVLRANFDEWLANQAEEAGAIVLGGITIDSLIFKDGKVVGVKQDNEELYADVVILAEGVNSRLMLQHGFHKDKKTRFEPHMLMGGYKEVYHLDKAVLEERFMLDEKEGISGEFIIGNIPNDVLAGGFFYTNNNSISLGTVVHLDSVEKEDRAYLAIEYFKQHPYIRRLIKDAELIEYGSKLVPEYGIKSFPNFYGAGWMVVGDAAGFVFSNGILIQGMNYAIKSGILAAEAFLEAKQKKNFGAAGLRIYEKKLNDSYILKDFKKFSKVKKLTKNPALFKKLPDGLNQGLHEYLTEDGKEKNKILTTLLKSMKKQGLGLVSLMKIGLAARNV
ncbi:MAG: FAD-dependent oxidoreductase [Candidatus Heimdallarchaeota archaeon]|nr:FAD-dependent oxidoreductase [Candidatus Heimdallarchaeota archaeon]